MNAEIARLIGGGLLALISCYIGLLIKRRYKARERFYKSAIDFCLTLDEELSMRKTPIPEICKRFLDGRNGAFEDMVKEWQSAIVKEGVVKEKLLKSEEIKEMQAFFGTLGKTDLKEQIEHVEYNQKAFERKRAECEEQSKKLGNMYFKLFALLGIAIILIVA